MLLPSRPDTVQESPSRKTQSSSPLATACPHKLNPGAGIQPRYSGLRVQGTATSPSSTTSFLKYKMAEREGFEPSRRGQHPSTRFPGERLHPLSHLSTYKCTTFKKLYLVLTYIVISYINRGSYIIQSFFFKCKSYL